MGKLKPCKIKNCPAQCPDCVEKDCVIKKAICKPWDRMAYVKRKLSGCLGYSDEEKKIRYEELIWVGKELEELFGIEVVDV